VTVPTGPFGTVLNVVTVPGDRCREVTRVAAEIRAAETVVGASLQAGYRLTTSQDGLAKIFEVSLTATGRAGRVERRISESAIERCRR
jgi:hypothetical protein